MKNKRIRLWRIAHGPNTRIGAEEKNAEDKIYKHTHPEWVSVSRVDLKKVHAALNF